MPAKTKATPKPAPAIKARPTLYKGIQMRSRLEADYAAHLDRSGSEWEYESECFAGPEGQWLPDFHEWRHYPIGGRLDTWIEVKPASMLECPDSFWQIDPILERMSVAWLSKPRDRLQLTFWAYGEQRAVMTVWADLNGPWCVFNGGLTTFLWPGMGQYDALDRSEEVAASAR